MPVIIPCPKCPAKLSAPESAAGRQIKCPKCGSVAEVPTFVAAEEVPVVEATVATAKPRSKPAPADDDDEPRPKRRAERDEDDQPRKPKRSRRANDDDDDYPHDHRQRRGRRRSGGSGVKIALWSVGGVVLLAGIGFGIWALLSKGGPLARKTPPPQGWKQYTDRDGTFRAYFPKEPEMMSIPVGGRQMGMGAGVGSRWDRFDATQFESGTLYASGNFNDSIHIEVIVYQARGKIPEAMRRELGDTRDASVGGMESRKIQWLGYDAAEVVTQMGVMRFVFTDRSAILAIVSGATGGRATKAEEEGFFDNFELTK